MKIELNIWLVLGLALVASVGVLFLRYGTLDRCEMMRQEVRLRFDGTVPPEVLAAPGAPLVVGLVEGRATKLLTFDLTPGDCGAKLFRLWLAADTEVGAILMDP